MSIMSAIATGASRSLSYIGRGISSVFGAIGKAIQTTLSFAGSYTAQGYRDVAKYTMYPQSKRNQQATSTLSERFAKVVLFPITYLPGAIAAATIAPLAYYTYKNFLPFAKLTNNKLNEYTDIDTDDDDYSDIPTYHGGPLKFYGLLGALLGLTIGTVFYTIPKIILYKMPVETLRSMEVWVINAFRASIFDKRNFHIEYDDRRFLSKVFGYIPLGIPLSALAFVVTASGVTLVRFVIETWRSIYNNTMRGINLATFDTNTEELKIYEDRSRYQLFLGIPGFIIGFGTGAAVATAITIIRVIIDSAKNFRKVFSIGASLPVMDSKELQFEPYKFKLNFSSFKDFRNSIKLSYRENVLGGLGYLLAPVALTIGLAFGAAKRVAFESYVSTANTIHILLLKIALRGRKNKYGTLAENAPMQTGKYYERVIGILGYPVGLAIMALPVTIIGLIRYGATNIDSGRRVFNYLTNSILPETQFKEDNRPGWVKFSSAPGALIGLTLGSTVRLTVESYYNFINISKLWLKTSLAFAPKSLSESEYLDIKNPTRTNPSRAWGAIGYILGAIVNTPLILGIFLARIIITNADSAKRAFAKQVNPKLSEKSQIKLEDDNRNRLLKRAGYPGSLIGRIVGGLGLISIESAVFFEYIFKNSILTSLHEVENPLLDEIETPNIEERSKIMGLPGILVGAVIGSVGFIVVGSGRVIFNTLQTIRHVTLDMVKFVRSQGEIPGANEFAELKRLRNFDYSELSQDDEDSDSLSTPKMRQDTRKNAPFYLGVLGLPIGGIIGLVAAATVGFFRIVKETAVRTYNESLYYARFALPKDKKYDINTLQSTQKPIDKMLGISGRVLGIPFGAFGFVVLGTIRSILDTFASIAVTIRTIANLPPVNYSSNPIDNRSTTDKILGGLGYVIGLPIGLALYTLRITVNVIYNSLATAKRDIRNIALWTNGEDIDSLILGIPRYRYFEKSKRTSFEQHGFGLPGHIIGAAIGAVIGAITISLRIIRHNYRSLLVAIQNTSNLVLKKKVYFANNLKYNDYVDTVQVTPTKFISIPKVLLTPLKYLAGLPGLILGGALATTFVIAPYYTKEFVKNNYLSYKHLSKSLINVGLEDYYFDGGVAADKRKNREKAAGFLGYTLALFTAGLVPVAHNLLKLASLAVSAVTFIPISIYKLICIGFFPRFTGQETDSKIQKIKNLYSSLEKGEYDGTRKMIYHADGRKGAKDFLRKAISLNLNTPTEDILAAELTNAQDPSFNLDEEINNIKNKHRGAFFFTREVRERRDFEIDDTITCAQSNIEAYIDRDVLRNYTPDIKDRSYSKLFFHSAPLTVEFDGYDSDDNNFNCR